ncbi:MAG TPA: choice-of-anchor D domain-containing protein [Bacteroidota bacterium]|nr:choice-of-anchor D domain-containing protein [Bacteroidota bacterium]
MKYSWPVFLVFVFTVSVAARTNKFNSGIFLHHSTGGRIWGPNDTSVSVPQQIDLYNTSHQLTDSNAFSLTEQHWPVASDNEWARWHRIFEDKDSTADIRPILKDNPIVIIKSCFPSSQMTGSGGPADTLTPDAKTIYNYKWHLRSIVRSMKEHPDNFFIIWTNAPLVRTVTNAMQAARSDSFCTWMKDTLARGLDAEFGTFPRNIFVFDFFHLTTDKDGFMLAKFAADSYDSHPNKVETMEITPRFVNEMFDAILDSYEPPVMSLSSVSLDFGEHAAGSKSAMTISLRNASRAQLYIDSIRTGALWFSAAFGKAGIAPGDSSVITVSFMPDSARPAYIDSLFIYNNSSLRVVAVPLRGSSPIPTLTSSDTALTFAGTTTGDTVRMTFKVYNRTINPLMIRTMTVSYPLVFSCIAQLPAAVNPRDSFLVTVRFTPKMAETFIDSLAIGWDGGMLRIPLLGVGERLTTVEARDGSLPREFSLSQNFPNPFNPSTTIRFALPEDSRVLLAVYDAIGRETLVLAEGDISAGVYSVAFNAAQLSSGMYFFRIRAAHHDAVYTETRRFILMK